MTALKGKAVQEFLRRPAAAGAVLVYGPDAGLVRERAEALARGIVDDFKDPFNYIEFTADDLKGEPGRLADEAAALSFAGGERVVRVKAAGDAATKAADTLLKALDAGSVKANALVILEAGDLAKSSALRKAFEKSKTAFALPCYADGPGEVRALALEAARGEDLRFDDDALELLVTLLGEDRGVSRSEIDKLVFYKGLKSQRSGPGTISVDDVRASLADGVGEALDEAAAAAADGAPERLSRALYTSAAAGASPIGLLRALVRQMSRLREARLLIDGGESTAGAMRRLRPPVFFMEQRPFERRLRLWSLPRLDAALEALLRAELDAKSTGAPQREIAEHVALQLSMMARRGP